MMQKCKLLQFWGFLTLKFMELKWGILHQMMSKKFFVQWCSPFFHINLKKIVFFFPNAIHRSNHNFGVGSPFQADLIMKFEDFTDIDKIWSKTKICFVIRSLKFIIGKCHQKKHFYSSSKHVLENNSIYRENAIAIVAMK